jgi:hypothetical protein
MFGMKGTIITYYNSPEKNHIDTLGERGIYYENKSDILYILRNLDKNEILHIFLTLKSF